MIIREILWRDADFDGCNWVHSGRDNEYETLDWKDNNTVAKPTEAELLAKWPAVKEQIILEHIRAKRNALLVASDWVVTRSQETGEPIPDEWQAYRQALRDMTNDISSVDMTAMDDGYWHDITGVAWPTKPE